MPAILSFLLFSKSLQANIMTVLKSHCDHFFRIISNSSLTNHLTIQHYVALETDSIIQQSNKQKKTAGKRRKPQVVMPTILSRPQYNTQSYQLSFFKVLYMFHACALKNAV
jgi:hypothetical protein